MCVCVWGGGGRVVGGGVGLRGGGVRVNVTQNQSFCEN